MYVVRPGDTLTAIASRFDLPLSTLAGANDFDPAHVLLIGKRLMIPAPALGATPVGVRDRLDAWSARLGVSPSLVRALAWMESGYQTDLTSSVGAWGVMQILPGTWSYVETSLIGRKVPRTASGNIRVGGRLEDIRFLNGESSPLKDGDRVLLVPSIAGG